MNSLIIRRTDSGDIDFQFLVKKLDLELKIRDGDDHLFYAELNKTGDMKQVIVAYEEEKPVGCGAIRYYDTDTMEVKRMYVLEDKRGRNIATQVLKSLEQWCMELRFSRCILETGINQPEAIRLYEKNQYHRIPNFGKYENMANSICFEKKLAAG